MPLLYGNLKLLKQVLVNLMSVALNSANNKRVIKVLFTYNTRLGYLIVHIVDSENAFKTQERPASSLLIDQNQSVEA